MKSPIPEKDQHFMIDEPLLDFISDFGKDKTVLEIGGGSGNLTKFLIKKAKKVVVIEKDQRFEDELKKIGVEVIIGDALKLNWPSSEVLISNLPYKICEALIMKFLRNDFEYIIVTFPKKLYEKFEDTKAGIFYSEMFKIKLLKEISKDSFEPKPKTKSVLLKLERKPSDNLLSKTIEQFDKKLKNALRESFCHFNMNKKEATMAINSMKLNDEILSKRIINLTNEEIHEFIQKLGELPKNYN